VDIDDVVATAERPPERLTRRDVARALLTVPAVEARAALPELRRELARAGNPFSAAFWESTETVLTSIERGAATVGEVDTWLEATGTEPTPFLEGFLWPEEDERGPVATEMHARLVAHLEERLAAGDIDPDRLVDGDEDERQRHRGIQMAWLTTPLDDGRTPMWAVEEEDTEQFLAAWAEVDEEARAHLAGVLEEVGPRPCPTDALAAAAARLRDEMAAPSWPYDLVAAGLDLAPDDLPHDDTELWLDAAAGAVEPRGEPPLSTDEAAGWMALDHADWIAAVATLARGGPGTPAGADDLARHAIESDDVDGVYEGDEWDVELSLSVGFGPAVAIWTALGAIDRDERLTELGWWGVPEAVLRAYSP
jgi:hypothetical protein